MHTELPWKTDDACSHCVGIFGSDGKPIVYTCTGERSREEDLANAEFIVRACNAHTDLIAACKGLLARYKRDFQGLTRGEGQFDCDEVRAAEAALAKAEPEK